MSNARVLMGMLLLTVIAPSGDAAQGPVQTGGTLHFATSLRLRGGKSLAGGSAGQAGTASGEAAAAGQGVQLPLLRNVLDFSTSLTAAANSSAGADSLGCLDPERIAFLQNAFAEMLENNTDVFVTAISRLSLPEDCEANVSLKERALFAIAGGHIPFVCALLC